LFVCLFSEIKTNLNFPICEEIPFGVGAAQDAVVACPTGAFLGEMDV